MSKKTYSLAFSYAVEGGRLKVDLTADVEEHHSDIWYIVKNFRIRSSGKLTQLPEVQLIKVKGSWVHRDSRKESELSRVIGAAIDASQ